MNLFLGDGHKEAMSTPLRESFIVHTRFYGLEQRLNLKQNYVLITKLYSATKI